MSFIWTPEFETGIATIDFEHRRMLASIHALAMPKGRSETTAELRSLLDAIEGHILTHFTHEESFMRVLGFPGVFAHMAEHARLKEYFACARAEVESNPRDLELMRMRGRLLANAIISHIRDADSHFAEWHRRHVVDQQSRRAG